MTALPLPLRLGRGHYAKLGAVHCGVSYHGKVTVAGDVCELRVGQSHLFKSAAVTAQRDEDGEDVVFTAQAPKDQSE